MSIQFDMMSSYCSPVPLLEYRLSGKLLGIHLIKSTSDTDFLVPTREKIMFSFLYK